MESAEEVKQMLFTVRDWFGETYLRSSGYDMFRDRYVSKVYKAEDPILNEAPYISLEEVHNLIKETLNHFGLGHNYELQNRIRKGGAANGYSIDIALEEEGYNKGIVLHELAHMIDCRFKGHTDHMSPFLNVYSYLLVRHFGKQTAQTLIKSLQEFKVAYSVEEYMNQVEQSILNRQSRETSLASNLSISM